MLHPSLSAFWSHYGFHDDRPCRILLEVNLTDGHLVDFSTWWLFCGLHIYIMDVAQNECQRIAATVTQRLAFESASRPQADCIFLWPLKLTRLKLHLTLLGNFSGIRDTTPVSRVFADMRKVFQYQVRSQFGVALTCCADFAAYAKMIPSLDYQYIYYSLDVAIPFFFFLRLDAGGRPETKCSTT